MGENEKDVEKAEATINGVLNADEETRNAIRSEQLKAAQDMNNSLYGSVYMYL
jgi:hypothetical protein